MRLRQKILARIYLLTLLLVLAMSVTYFYLFTKDMRERSQYALTNAFTQVFDDLHTRAETVSSKIGHFLSSSIANPMYMIGMFQEQRDPSQPPTIWYIKKLMTYLNAITQGMYEFSTLTEASQIILYDQQGRLLALYRNNGEQPIIGAYLAELGDGVFVEFRSNDRWYALIQSLDEIQAAVKPDDVPLTYSDAMPDAMQVSLNTLQSRLAVEFRLPVIDQETRLGVCVIQLALREEDAARYARVSGMEVNFFAGRTFSAGTLPSFRELPEKFAADTHPLNILDLNSLSHFPLRFDQMETNGHGYYQGSAILGQPGQPVGAITIHYPRQLEEMQRRRFLAIAGSITLLFSVFAILEAFGMSGAIVRPIYQLATAMKELQAGNFDADAHITTGDELQSLSEAFHTMGQELKDNLKRKEEQERLRREMELARRIQTAILPTHFQHDGLEIEATMLTAEEVGGDYYDVLHDKDGTLWLGIGDVSGHGVTPGLIMLMAQTIHTTVATHLQHRPNEVVSAINRVLYHNVRERLGEDHFMTFTALKYLGEGEFEHAGAHLTMIIYRRAAQHIELVKTDGVFLNFIPDIADVTTNGAFRLDIGDVLVLYTDGLTESFAPDGTMLDLSGFQRIILSHAEEPLLAMRDGILNDVLDWCHQDRKDDMSLLLVRRVH